jgi:Tol biopolymer transport system component/DNA-binding winged helix-turn-helix (wHTH) protein
MPLLIRHLYQFGEFAIDSDQRVLLRKGKPVPLTPKAFDVLLLLVENSGRIVEKEELMSRLWPDTFVEEANLSFNIQQLRKSLRDNARRPRFIETVARRGYRFIADVEEVLSDRSETGGSISGKVEPKSALAPRWPDTQITPQELDRTASPVRDSQQTVTEQIADATGSAVVSTVRRKRILAFAIVLIAVGAVGFILWRISTGSNNFLKPAGVAEKTPAAIPLKIEKLTGTGHNTAVAITADGKFVAYTQDIDQKAGIWLRELATNTNFEIAPPTGPVYQLAFANSGQHLYFCRGTPNALYRISLHGGVPARILDDIQGKFSISSDDSQIAFLRDIRKDDGRVQRCLMTAGSDGAGERILFEVQKPYRLDSPIWSPDDKNIICSYGNALGGLDMRLVEITLADGQKRELFPDRFFQINRLARLPNKNDLLMSARQLGESSQLWRISYPDGLISQITEGLSSYMDLGIAANSDKAVASQATRISDIWIGSSSGPRKPKRITQAIDNFCWTRNGRLIYSSTASGNRDLWIMRPDGTEQKQLTNDPAVDGTPAVPADDRYVVFMSNRSGTFQVWRMNIDGSDQIQLTDGPAKNFPSISSDGNWVFYNTSDDWHMWKVSIKGGEPVRVTDFPAQSPAFSPDGKMIACSALFESKLRLLILPFEGGPPSKIFEGSSRHVHWSPDGKALIYSVESNGTTNILKQSLEGGPAQESMTFDAADVFDFGYSYDGQLFAVTRGDWQHDIVLLKNLL